MWLPAAARSKLTGSLPPPPRFVPGWPVPLADSGCSAYLLLTQEGGVGDFKSYITWKNREFCFSSRINIFVLGSVYAYFPGTSEINGSSVLGKSRKASASHIFIDLFLFSRTGLSNWKVYVSVVERLQFEFSNRFSLFFYLLSVSAASITTVPSASTTSSLHHVTSAASVPPPISSSATYYAAAANKSLLTQAPPHSVAAGSAPAAPFAGDAAASSPSSSSSMVNGSPAVGSMQQYAYQTGPPPPNGGAPVPGPPGQSQVRVVTFIVKPSSNFVALRFVNIGLCLEHLETRHQILRSMFRSIAGAWARVFLFSRHSTAWATVL